MEEQLVHEQSLAVLTEASAALTEAGLDTPVVLDTITDLLVEHVGDSAIVYLMSADGVHLDVGSVTSRNPAVAPSAYGVVDQTRYDMNQDSLVTRCARSRLPVMYPLIDLRDVDPPLPPAYRHLFDATPVRSLAYVPLATHDETFGVLAVTRILADREPMDDADFELLCDLGELATRALANLELHRALARSTALFETAFHSAPVGMALVSTIDDPGRIIRVNTAICEMTGYPEEDLLAMRVSDLFPHARERVEQDVRRAAAGQEAEAATVGQIVRRDGTEVDARIDARAVDVPGGPARLGLLQMQVPPPASL